MSATEPAYLRPAPGRRPPPRRARTRRRRALALVALALGVLALGVIVSTLMGESEEERAGERFAAAWQRGDYAAMYRELTPRLRSEIAPRRFRDAYASAAATATAVTVETGEPGTGGGEVRIPVAVRTRVFGIVRGEVRLPVSEAGIRWTPSATFPDVPPGTVLRRESTLPRRARILSRDGETIVSGPAGERTAEGPAASIAGEMGAPATAAEREELYARGFPRDTQVGTSGLERALEEQVAGTPGGRLLARERVLARSRPRPAEPVRSTIDARIQEVAVGALGARFGGIAALDAKTAEVRALVGIAFSSPQPPGSTFKLVTTTAALEAGLVKPSDEFPVLTSANVGGFNLQNAHGEACGGTFTNSFANSCNSVFGPLGVKIGARRLVRTARRFGWDEKPTIPGAEPSTIPPVKDFESDLEVAVSAIGQGKVLTTPLQMASIAQTIASRGIRRAPRLSQGAAPREPVRVMPAKTARTIEELMVEVVKSGTGTSASLAPITVAGKTGTAELGVSGRDGDGSSNLEHAWFTAYAPLREPKIAVAVLVVYGGAGGQVAAPIARPILEAGATREL